MLAWNTASCSAGVRRSSSAADITLGPMEKGYQSHAVTSIRSLGTWFGPGGQYRLANQGTDHLMQIRSSVLYGPGPRDQPTANKPQQRDFPRFVTVSVILGLRGLRIMREGVWFSSAG